MIKQIRICDHCGHEIDTKEKYYTVTAITYDVKTTTEQSYDYCGPCGLKVVATLRGKAEDITEIPDGMTVTAFETEEHAPEEPKKHAGGRPKRKLDMGKVKALRAAGWTLANIADEMGVAPSIIQRALAEAQREANNE